VVGRYALAPMNMTSALKAGSTALAVATIGFGVTACGSSSKAAGVVTAPGAGATTASATATTASTTTTAAAAATSTVKTPTSGPLSQAPTITKPTAAAPKSLVKKILVSGNGTTAAAGDSLTVNYVGAIYATGKVFQSSFSDGQGPFGPFQLGAGAVIKGWDQGLVGVKAGSRVQLIIPPSLGYGASAQSGIPANSTLIFDIDVLAVSK
jgi:FKBP-type peptidyl-prolyl cis-trans isomerase